MNEKIVQTLRGTDWLNFSERVVEHIENYTVPQYGDRTNDLLSEFYTPHGGYVFCMAQIKKYASRAESNQREQQQDLDLLKIAHYAQLAADFLKDM